MNWPWNRDKETNDVIGEDEYKGYDPSSDDDEGSVEGEEPEAEPSLDDFEDEETRSRVERLLAREREQVRAPLRDMGLDFNSDGRAMIADAAKVSTWAGAVVSPRQQQQQPTATQPPTPNAAPAAEEDDSADFDMLSATPADLARFIDRRVSKQTKGLEQENLYLRGLMQQRAVSESTRQVREIVAERLPTLAPLMDHPDFAPEYERQIAGANPEFLANPLMVTGMVAAICAGLDKERMPMPRDDQGRFTTPPAPTDAQARHQAARQGLQGTPPARGGAPPGRQAPDPRMDEGVGYLREIERHLPSSVEGRPSLTAAEWDAAKYADIDSWRAAMERSKAAAGNRGRQR